MTNKLMITLSLLSGFFVANDALADNLCKGHFVNPITDVQWNGMLPISIGSAKVAHSSLPDTKNPSSPICVCDADIGWQVGITLGYWEPFTMVDVTRDPGCFPGLDGIHMDLGNNDQVGGSDDLIGTSEGGFYWAHWYFYPLMAWLNILTDTGCMTTGEYDIGYITELDPSWDDDSLAAILSPEASIFSDPISQSSCAADASATIAGELPIDSLSWCMGAQGSVFPLSGTSIQKSPIQSAALMTERLDYKMHDLGMVPDSVGENSPGICSQHYNVVMPKSRYRYQMVGNSSDTHSCYPFGRTVSDWEGGHDNVGEGDNFSFLIFRKRNCCFL